jgi:hypothetical protein
MKQKISTLNLTFAAVLVLSGCSSMEKKEIASAYVPVPTVTEVQINHVKIYKSRAEIPKYSKIIGTVTAQNYNLDGTKASPVAIIAELKRLALLQGGYGIVHITKGTAQTTADVVA